LKSVDGRRFTVYGKRRGNTKTKIPNHKFQITNKFQAPNSNFQNKITFEIACPFFVWVKVPARGFGDWNLEFIWNLVLVIWNLSPMNTYLSPYALHPEPYADSLSSLLRVTTVLPFFSVERGTWNMERGT
jgi:hypothetical protein